MNVKEFELAAELGLPRKALKQIRETELEPERDWVRGTGNAIELTPAGRARVAQVLAQRAEVPPPSAGLGPVAPSDDFDAAPAGEAPQDEPTHPHPQGADVVGAASLDWACGPSTEERLVAMPGGGSAEMAAKEPPPPPSERGHAPQVERAVTGAVERLATRREAVLVVVQVWRNPRIVQCVVKGDAAGEPQRVKVRDNKHFIKGMELTAVHEGGDLWNMVGRCPRWRGRW